MKYLIMSGRSPGYRKMGIRSAIITLLVKGKGERSRVEASWRPRLTMTISEKVRWYDESLVTDQQYHHGGKQLPDRQVHRSAGR